VLQDEVKPFLDLIDTFNRYAFRYISAAIVKYPTNNYEFEIRYW